MMAHLRRAAVSLLLPALTACAGSAPPAQPGAGDSPQVVAARENPSPRFIGLISAKAQHAPPFLGVPQTNFYCLRSFLDRQTGETRHQLYVSDSYFGVERRWNAARDGAGRSLRFIEISREEISCDNGCSYTEEFAAELPESALRAATGGLAVTFTARSGAEKTISVPGKLITAQLAAVDASHNPLQPAAARTGAAPPAK
jgi:hypothetical protein